MNKQKQSYDTIVIGGGQAGLATGYHLQQQGQNFVILDAALRTGDSWRQRWDSLHLFTPAPYSSLPGLPFPASRDHLPNKDEMADYLENYVRHFELPVKRGVRVDHLTREGNRFVISAGSRRFEAANVVVATGAYQSPKVPALAADLSPEILQMHSSTYQRPSQLRSGKVLVVGAANSGAEIALELSKTHKTWLSGPHPGSEPFRPGHPLSRFLVPVMWFVFSHILNVKTPIGRKMKPHILHHGIPLARVRPDDLLEAGVKRVHDKTVAAKDGLPVLENGRTVQVDNVIWCTGYKPDFSWIDLPVIGPDGYPSHEKGIVQDMPGLYFVGLLFQTAVISALIGGVGKDAAYIAQKIAARPVSAVASQNGRVSSPQTADAEPTHVH